MPRNNKFLKRATSQKLQHTNPFVNHIWEDEHHDHLCNICIEELVNQNPTPKLWSIIGFHWLTKVLPLIQNHLV